MVGGFCAKILATLQVAIRSNAVSAFNYDLGTNLYRLTVHLVSHWHKMGYLLSLYARSDYIVQDVSELVWFRKRPFQCSIIIFTSSVYHSKRMHHEPPIWLDIFFQLFWTESRRIVSPANKIACFLKRFFRRDLENHRTDACLIDRHHPNGTR